MNCTHTNNPIWWKLIFRTSKISTKVSWNNRVKRKRKRRRSRKRMKEERKEEIILILNIKWPFSSWWLNSIFFKQRTRRSKHLLPKRRNLELTRKFSKAFSSATMTNRNNGIFVETSSTRYTPSWTWRRKCPSQNNQKPTNGSAYFDS